MSLHVSGSETFDTFNNSTLCLILGQCEILQFIYTTFVDFLPNTDYKLAFEGMYIEIKSSVINLYMLRK